MPLVHMTDAISVNGVRCEKICIPFPIASGWTKKFNSSIKRFSMREETKVAPPYRMTSFPVSGRDESLAALPPAGTGAHAVRDGASRTDTRGD